MLYIFEGNWYKLRVFLYQLLILIIDALSSIMNITKNVIVGILLIVGLCVAGWYTCNENTEPKTEVINGMDKAAADEVAIVLVDYAKSHFAYNKRKHLTNADYKVYLEYMNTVYGTYRAKVFEDFQAFCAVYVITKIASKCNISVEEATSIVVRGSYRDSADRILYSIDIKDKEEVEKYTNLTGRVGFDRFGNLFI